MQQQQLTQSEVEWLRCLTISRKLIPILPEDVRLKLEGARLLEAIAGKAVITESGTALLLACTPREPVVPARVSR
jgi:hypothetical protein